MQFIALQHLFQMMIKHRHKQIKIEIIKCVTLKKTKLRIFIFACFKNAIDCIIIEIPLNDKIPEHKQIDAMLVFCESIFAPLVTSKSPKMKPSTSAWSNFNVFVIGKKQ